MISVQKRKSTCSPANDSNSHSHKMKLPSGSTDSTGTSTVKSSRKRTKLGPNRSHSASLASGQQRIATGRGGSGKNHHHGPAATQEAANSDESVWIFGLINNIEQLLSTFTAINTSSATSCANSGTSTPSSLSSSSFSFSSAASSRSASASSSTANSPSSSSTCSSASSTGGPHAQAALGQLPRSPISRQIKFHEYKGPPSAKRQPQQQQQSAKPTHHKPPSTATTTSSDSTDSKPSNANQAPVAANNEKPPGGAYTQSQVSCQALLAQQSCNADQEQPIGARQVLAYAQPSAPVRPQQQQQRQCSQATSAQNQLTSGPHCQMANMQTFYMGQQQPSPPSQLLEDSAANGQTVLLAPFIQETERQTLVNAQQEPARYQFQQQQQQHAPLMQVRSAGEQATPCAASNGTISFALRPPETSGRIQTRPLAGNLNERPAESRQEQQLHQAPQTTAGSLSDMRLENSAAPFGQQQQALEFADYLQPQPFNHNHQHHHHLQQQQQQQQQQELQIQLQQQQQHGFSRQEFSSLHDDNVVAVDNDFAPFGPDSEETDACEIEPSISFSQGVEELLFSEFIDLQDVPMNVDESDWLKKFLPPCSMG